MSITSFEQINNSNTIIVLYPSGASGEFLAGAIAKSFDAVHSSTLNDYDTYVRYKYFDLFDRELNSSTTGLDEHQVLGGVKKYISTNCDPTKAHIGLAHSTKNCVDFIQRHLNNTKIIEITTTDTLSKKFRIAAADSKISKHQQFTDQERRHFHFWAMQHRDGQCKVNNKLFVEWLDLFINDTPGTIRRLEHFLQSQCDKDKFTQIIQDYNQRNIDIMEQCGIVGARNA